MRRSVRPHSVPPRFLRGYSMIRRMMPIVLLLFAGAVGAADLRTLKNETLKGELVSANDKDLVFNVAGENRTLPVAVVSHIDFSPEGKIAPDAKYADLELT